MRPVMCLLACIALFGAAQAQTRKTTELEQRAPEETLAAPRPQQVEVVNFPATQQIAGTVSVGNLPAVQQVTGEVTVSNLPTGCEESAFVVVRVAAVPVESSCDAAQCLYVSEPFETAGWKVLSAYVVRTDPSTGALGAGPAQTVWYRSDPADPFAVQIQLDGTASAPVRGTEAAVTYLLTDTRFPASHFGVYLSR